MDARKDKHSDEIGRQFKFTFKVCYAHTYTILSMWISTYVRTCVNQQYAMFSVRSETQVLTSLGTAMHLMEACINTLQSQGTDGVKRSTLCDPV